MSGQSSQSSCLNCSLQFCTMGVTIILDSENEMLMKCVILKEDY